MKYSEIKESFLDYGIVEEGTVCELRVLCLDIIKKADSQAITYRPAVAKEMFVECFEVQRRFAG